jgi:tyrosine-protein kinase Etk/Wzc
MTQVSPNSDKFLTKPQQSDDIDLMKYVFLILGNWYWFILSLVVALVLAWQYMEHTLPVWRTSSYILIEDDKRQKAANIGTDQLLQGFGLQPGMQNLQNQLFILSSWTLIDKTISALPLETEYYTKGRINKVAYYPDSPVKVITDTSSIVPRNIEFEIRFVDNNNFILKAGSRKSIHFEKRASFGEPIDLDGGRIKIDRLYDLSDNKTIPESVYFVIHSHDQLVDSYRSRLKATSTSKEATIIQLSLDGPNRRMDEAFLSKLMEVFLQNNLERKNAEATRTINFIERQLSGISDSLSITEDRLQKFRSANRVMDISSQGQQIIDQAMALENQKAQMVIEANYYEYLADYLNKEISGDLPVSPATIGISDPGLTRLVAELADLQSQYFGNGMTDKNPMKAQIAQRLKNTRAALTETLKGVRHANDLALKENARQIRTVNASAASLPKTERELLGFQRQFKLKDVLYSFLIEKMAEAQIQKASNTPDHEIVDNPRTESSPISPKSNKIYLIAILAGLGIPLIFIIIVDALNNVIKNEEELKKITDLPVSGYVLHNSVAGQTVVLDDPSSVLSESFRTIRTRLQFFTRNIKSPVILLTSSMPGEGKTFTALNLASVQSLIGKKTILLEFDLRRPKLYSQLGLSVNKGLSTYLIGQNTIDEIVVDSGYDNLDILPAGPIPPNPAELIASPLTEKLFLELRNRYDYIIVDTAPVGVVSDTTTLAHFADTTMILVRHNVTIGPMLSTTINNLMGNGISGISIVMNDIGLDANRYGYKYRYGYRYRYSYGYQYKYAYQSNQ